MLAILVLLSTFSFTVEKHYCGQMLVDVALYTKAKDCGMSMMKMNDSSLAQTQVKKKSCCKDELTFVKGQDQLEQSTSIVGWSKAFTVCTPTLEMINLFKTVAYDAKHSWDDYGPPDLIWDFQVLHQVYLV